MFADIDDEQSIAASLSTFSRHIANRVATATDFDAVKTWGTATEGVTVPGFAFDPQDYAPKYRRVHPLVLKFAPAAENRGGGGATVVELKE